MNGLHEWMEARLAEHKTEPNSGLGKAIYAFPAASQRAARRQPDALWPA
jgi:hypothetical protein